MPGARRRGHHRRGPVRAARSRARPRRHDRGPGTYRETSRGARQAIAVTDVRDLPALSAAVADGVNALGRLDIVSVNTGIFAVGSEAGHATLRERLEIWRATLDTNLTRTRNTLEASVPHIVAGNHGGAIAGHQLDGLAHRHAHRQRLRHAGAALSGRLHRVQARPGRADAQLRHPALPHTGSGSTA
ncbi:SDR family NAD(P)-dependent oxidoreductase [Streptomyces mirabilis]|uniref:SDR family NAD(P)-dependent oxidoreductase n=1 Tax=Streptomyces mirabilis TaxID=68239 RepID=UPI00331FA8B6